MSIPHSQVRSVYLAAPFSQKNAAHVTRKILSRTFDVTSRWIDSHLSDWTTPDEKLTSESLEDLADINRADGFVLLNLPGSSGGMYAEFGYALARNKPIWIVGERTRPSCIFFWHPSIVIVKSVEEI